MSVDSAERDTRGLAAGADATAADPSRRWMARLYGALSGGVGTIAGIAPHVLHHVGPIAGAALLTGTGGSIVFGVVGLVLMLPLLWRLKRRFGNWLAPAIALAIFASMFTISTVWIGPVVRDAINGDDDNENGPVSDPHHSSARRGVDEPFATSFEVTDRESVIVTFTGNAG